MEASSDYWVITEEIDIEIEEGDLIITIEELSDLDEIINKLFPK